MVRPTVAEIDLSAIAFNYNQIRNIVGSRVKIAPAVKADAYGHGAIEVSRTLIECGAYMLCVATPDEAIELRDAGIRHPILLLQTILPDQIPDIVNYGIRVTICDIDTAKALSGYAYKHETQVNVHVKVDTGMGRIGVPCEEAVSFVEQIVNMPGLRLEGLFTHFPSADEDDLSYTANQVNEINRICDCLSKSGIGVAIRHAANSAAILNMPGSWLDMVRPGIMIYGHRDFVPLMDVELRPALTLKSKIVFLKWVPPGRPVSYNRTYITKKDTLIATVPIGYADGYNRGLSNKGVALVRGTRVPIIGRICMDQLMMDVTSVPNVEQGDEVVLYGCQGSETITVEEVARTLDTISYELLCSISKRVPRIYVP